NPSPPSMDAAEEALATAIASEDAQSAALSKVYVASRGVFGSETDRSLLLLDEALSVFRESGDSWGEGFAGFQRMEVLAHRGELAAAIDQGEAALACYQKTGDPWATSAALAHLGWYGRMTGRIEWSEEITGGAVGLARSRRLPHTVQYVMTDQGYLRLLVGEQDEARRTFEMALAIAIDVGNPVGAATIRNAIGESLLTSGSVEDAQQAHREALAGFEDANIGSGVAYTLARLGLSAETAGAWKEAERHHQAGLRAAADTGAVIELVPVIEGLARVAAAGGETERAARLLAGARSLRHRSGLVRLPVEEVVTESADRRVRAAAGSDVLEEATREAEDMDPVAMIAIASR
ncbi:MAG TPA: hypothetical protein VK969_04035, partial [Acidimicrobiia bacterium]|nr:hypothetical protein [Acidimicrobiia bacterium]